MWKKLIFLFFIFLLIPNYLFADSTHLQKLNSKYPYALIGNDYELLSEEDLALNGCEALPSPFSLTSTSYPYWQCFETKNTKLFCDGHKYDENEKDYLTILVISGTKNNQNHEYISRRAIHSDDCFSYKKDWHRLSKGEKYVCVSGPFIEKEKNSKGLIIHSWIFNSFKTKKGCESYFKGGCSLQYQLKQGNKCNR